MKSKYEKRQLQINEKLHRRKNTGEFEKAIDKYGYLKDHREMYCNNDILWTYPYILFPNLSLSYTFSGTVLDGNMQLYFTPLTIGTDFKVSWNMTVNSSSGGPSATFVAGLMIHDTAGVPDYVGSNIAPPPYAGNVLLLLGYYGAGTTIPVITILQSYNTTGTVIGSVITSDPVETTGIYTISGSQSKFKANVRDNVAYTSDTYTDILTTIQGGCRSVGVIVSNSGTGNVTFNITFNLIVSVN